MEHSEHWIMFERLVFNFLNFFPDNVDDGKASSLASTAKRCAMALIAKVTWNVATKYNFDYKKNLDRDRKFNYTWHTHTHTYIHTYIHT